MSTVIADLFDRKIAIVCTVAKSGAPTACNYYRTVAEAEADMPRILADNTSGYFIDFRIGTVAECDADERAYYLGLPLASLSAAQHDYLLNVLPPLRWERGDTLSRFLMSESIKGVYAEQVITLRTPEGRRHFIKTVDKSDRATWPTEASILAALAAGAVAPTTEYQWLNDDGGE